MLYSIFEGCVLLREAHLSVPLRATSMIIRMQCPTVVLPRYLHVIMIRKVRVLYVRTVLRSQP